MDNCIEVKNLSKSYGTKCILNDLSLSIQKNKITTIMGSNGSGKSTLLSILANQCKYNEGTIKLNGLNLKSFTIKSFSKTVAYVSQYNTIDSDITVKEFIKYGRIPYSGFLFNYTTEDESYVNQAIIDCDLKQLEDLKISSLSGGQRQRVFIALALAKKCSILLLDEPTTYMDIQHQIELLSLIKKIGSNITIVMVLHDINQALHYSDVIIGMNEGNIVFNGMSKDIDENVIKDIYGIHLEVKLMDGKKYVISTKEK